MGSTRSRLVVVSFWIAVVVAPVGAEVAKCQKELELQADKLNRLTSDALALCKNAVRTEVEKNTTKPGTGFLATAAHQCQVALAELLDMSNSKPGKSHRDRFYAGINAAFTQNPVKCTAADLPRLGHLVSGASGGQAPGSAPHDWIKNWLAVDSIRRAVSQQLGLTPDLFDLLLLAKKAPAKAAGNLVSTAATNCSLPMNCNPGTVKGCRPDLCSFDLHCHTRACKLSAANSAGVIKIGSLGGSFLNLPIMGTFAQEFCRLEGAGYDLGNAGEGYLIMGGPARLLSPVVVLGNTICVDQVGSEGFCACSGNFLGVQRDFQICQDHVLSNGDACDGNPVMSGGPEGPCYCGFTEGTPPPIGSPQCDGATGCANGTSCGFSLQGARCHPGTTNGPIRLDMDGQTTAGDCTVLHSVRFRIIAGSQKGVDGVACTSDDTAPSLAINTLAMTTGTASAKVYDAVQGHGTCSGGAPNVACIENANCGTGTCTGEDLKLVNLELDSVSGNKINSCTNIETGNLSGLSLAGAFVALDTRYGDEGVSFKFTCE